jgi:hypothetical protein
MEEDILMDKLINKVKSYKESIESILSLLDMKMNAHFMKVNFKMVLQKLLAKCHKIALSNKFLFDKLGKIVCGLELIE